MATYPTGLYSHITLVDNVDDVLAAHPNTLGGEIVALETKLGINSSAITASIDYFLKHVSGAYRTHTHDGSSDDGANIPVANITALDARITALELTSTDSIAITMSATNGNTNPFSFNLTTATYNFGTTDSSTNLFTFTKAGVYLFYAWAEANFTSWSPVINGGGALTHNQPDADVLAIYIRTMAVGDTFKYNFITTTTAELTGKLYLIVRLSD